MPDPKRVYWDSCAWIGLINAEPSKVFPLRSVWEAAQRGEYEIWTSTYCYMELHYGVSSYGEPYPAEESDDIFERMLSQPYVKRVQLSVPIAKLSRKLKRDLHKDGLSKKADAIHLATALATDCKEMHTWDAADLLQFDGKVICHNGQPLRILKPGNEYLDAPLFAEPDPISTVIDVAADGGEEATPAIVGEGQQHASSEPADELAKHVKDIEDAEAEEQSPV